MLTSIKNAIFVLFIYGTWLFVSKSKGFIKKSNSSYRLQNNVSKLVSHVDFKPQRSRVLKRSLKNEVSRNKSDSKDRFISIESCPKLIIRRGQSQRKTKSHGALTNIPSRVKKNGRTLTWRTEKNIDQFTDAVKKTIRNTNSI